MIAIIFRVNVRAMNEPTDRKARSHERIVDAAARAIRQRGYAGVGVADVMKEAGLTHGGFYAHFPSRDALIVAALERAGRGSAESIRQRAERLTARGYSPFRVLVESYLHATLLSSPDAGCPVAALCSEMPRQEGDVRRASTDARPCADPPRRAVASRRCGPGRKPASWRRRWSAALQTGAHRRRQRRRSRAARRDPQEPARPLRARLTDSRLFRKEI